MSIKNKLTKVIMQLFVMVTVFIITAIPAYANVWTELEKYHSEETEAQAAQALSPFLKFTLFILAIISIIVIVTTVIVIAIKAGKVATGKDSFSKKWVGTTAAVLIISLLVGGGSWVKLFSAGQKIIVDPATNILTNENENGNTATPAAK